MNFPKASSILMVIERFFPIVGGAESQCLQLSSEFAQNGLATDVVTKKWLNSLKSEEVMKEGFTVYRLGLPGQGRFSDYFSGLILAFFLIFNILFKRKKWDYFYINGGLANIFASTAILIGKIFGKKVISKVETPGELTFSGRSALSPKRYVHPLIRLRLMMVKESDIFIAQTQKIYEELIAFGVRKDKIVTITNSVDEELFSPPSSEGEKSKMKRQLQFSLDKPIVTFCGRLVRRKGLLPLLEAWGNLKTRAELVLVGSGKSQPDSVENDLLTKVKEKKITNVIFLGDQPRDRVAKILKASDLFVYPSIHPEGTALSVLEAMSSGLAVIVSDIGGLSDVVADNNEGLLVPPGNSKLLSQAITKLLDDKRSRRRMGEVGRKTILDKYTVKIIAQKYLNEVFV